MISSLHFVCMILILNTKMILSSEKSNFTGIMDTIDYLKNYGYFLDEKINIGPQMRSGLSFGKLETFDAQEKIRDPLKRFQQLHRLNVTGVLDESTLKKNEITSLWY